MSSAVVSRKCSPFGARADRAAVVDLAGERHEVHAGCRARCPRSGAARAAAAYSAGRSSGGHRDRRVLFRSGGSVVRARRRWRAAEAGAAAIEARRGERRATHSAERLAAERGVLEASSRSWSGEVQIVEQDRGRRGRAAACGSASPTARTIGPSACRSARARDRGLAGAGRSGTVAR